MVSQKSISSSPTDQTRDGSRRESLKAPRTDEAEGKIPWMNRGDRAEKNRSSASPCQLCCWLSFWGLSHAPSSVPASCQAGKGPGGCRAHLLFLG